MLLLKKIVAAAKNAAAHDMIPKLPEGYATAVTTTGGRLSGGQIQRIGLTRAMYNDPVFLVLDEPNSIWTTKAQMRLTPPFAQ